MGSTDTDLLSRTVVETGADLGIAYDGDGDRVMFVDRDGSLVDGDEILYIIATYRLARGKSCEGVVGTLMSNLGLEIALKEHGLEFARAKVGDRLVLGENVGQAFQFVYTGHADLGLVAMSQVLDAGDGGSWWPVPAAAHAPIAQDALLIRDRAPARAFYAYLFSTSAKLQLDRTGYIVPSDTAATP